MATQILPFILRSTGWAGNDGNWSTFTVGVGTPLQNFSVLPSLINGEIVVPAPDACDPSIPNCASARGVLDQSEGFQSNESSTWDQIGIYKLSAENNLYYISDEDGALYGLENVSIGSEDGIMLENQTVGAFGYRTDFWLGSLGLGIQASNFSNLPDTAGTLVTSMQVQNLTTSLSYGYYAGAAYLNSAGGLVIGGYDNAAFDQDNSIQAPVYFNGPRSLTVGLKSLVVTNTLQGTISPSIATEGLNMSLDSTTSQIWLPQSICDTLADALNLTYDPGTELYFIEFGVRESLVSWNPVFTFTLAADGSSNTTTNIVLPYAAFDQQIGQPWSTSNTMYFPLRRAANESQFVLGRTFLQEAYLVVDWERQNFTLGQSKHLDGVSSDIAPIMPLPQRSGRSGGLGTGAIAGIAIGAVAVVLIATLVVWFLWRKKQKDVKRAAETLESQKGGEYSDDKKYPEDIKQQEGEITELPSPGPKIDADMLAKYGSELESPGPKSEAQLRAMNRHEMPSPGGTQSPGRHELEAAEQRQQLMSNPVYELPGHDTAQEMDGESQRERSRRPAESSGNETPAGSPTQMSTLDRLGW